MAILDIEFKNIESNDVTKCNTSCSNSNTEMSNNESDIDSVIESISTSIHETYKNILEKVWSGLLIQL